MVASYGFALQAMATIPTPIFCSSPDPCSCEGGGFALYKPLCAAAAAVAREANNKMNTTNNSNNTNASVSTTASGINMTRIQNEYVSLFAFLGNDTATVLVSIGVVVVIGITFALVRLFLGLRRANDDKYKVELQRRELLDRNRQIQSELAVHQLSKAQTEIVHAGAAELEAVVPHRFKISSKEITFEALLGSGSFGDCYKGYFHNFVIAAKQMRVVSCSSVHLVWEIAV